MKKSPTARTLEELRRQNKIADKAEHWVSIAGYPAGGVRKDLFGFIDILAIETDAIVAIQATSRVNINARVRKIVGECNTAAKAFLSAGGKIEVWGWEKRKTMVDGRYWFADVVNVTLDLFP